MPLVYDCTVQLPFVEAELAVGAGPVPTPPELPLLPLLDPEPELLPDAPPESSPLASPPPSSPPEPPEPPVLEAPRTELPELDPAPELVGSEPLELVEYDPLELAAYAPLDPFDPEAPLLLPWRWLPPPLDPPVPVEPSPELPPAHAPTARHGTSSHVDAQPRMIILGSLFFFERVTRML